MKCSTCGTSVAKEEQRCPKCGNKIKRKKSINSFIIIVAITASLLMLVFAVSTLISVRNIQRTLDDYQAVSSHISSIENNYVDANGFADPERVDQLMAEVSSYAGQLYNAGQLSDYSYAEGDTGVYMEVDGWLGVIYSPEIEGLMSAGPEEVTIYTCEPNEAEFYPMYAFAGFQGPDEAANKITETFNGFRHHEFNGKNVSIENLKQIKPNSIVMWVGHGCYNAELGSGLFLGTEKYDQATLLVYMREFADKAIVMNIKGQFYITSVFFDKYMPEGCFEGSLVYLGACSSIADPHSRLVESIANKGARAILGNTLQTNTIYNISIGSP